MIQRVVTALTRLLDQPFEGHVAGDLVLLPIEEQHGHQPRHSAVPNRERVDARGLNDRPQSHAMERAPPHGAQPFYQVDFLAFRFAWV